MSAAGLITRYYDAFNAGDYYKAVEDEVSSETVTKVLYPNDEPDIGKLPRADQRHRGHGE